MKKSPILLFVFFILIAGCKNQLPGTINFTAIRPNQVRLMDGPFRVAQERNKQFLYGISPDKLLANFRKVSGLEVRIPAYGGWEDHEIRGHFMGHYLSACAMMYATTGDSLLHYRAHYLVLQLKKCQDAYGNGYVSAFPEEFFDRAENLKLVWAPYYTQHKIMAGLFDCYNLCGDSLALEVLKGMADWLDNRCKNISHDKMQKILDQTEQGGINEVLFNLYGVTKEPRYLALAQKFYKESFLQPLAAGIDSLSGKPCNACIPIVTGIAREYELTGDSGKREMAERFWDQVTGSRIFITGGTGNREHWNAAPHHMSKELGLETHEFCATYNLLKLSSHVYSWTNDTKYADYIERLMWNGILPAQDPETGLTMYCMPMAPGNFKTFSSSDKSFWCSTGTGIETYTRIGMDIYDAKGTRIYVNQYIASTLIIPEAVLSIWQNTVFPKEQSTSFEISLKKPVIFDLMLRIPPWIKGSCKVLINDKALTDTIKPGSYLKISRKWKNGDKVVLGLPMNYEFIPMPDDPSMGSFTFGPVVLAGALSGNGIFEENTYNMFASYQNSDPAVPTIGIKNNDMASGITPINQVSMRIRSKSGEPVDFIPFYELFRRRYMVYFPVYYEK